MGRLLSIDRGRSCPLRVQRPLRGRPEFTPPRVASRDFWTLLQSVSGASGDLVIRLVVRTRDLRRDLADELGGERDDLLLVEALRLEIAVDRLRKDLHRTGLGFTIGHGGNRSASTRRASAAPRQASGIRAA